MTNVRVRKSSRDYSQINWPELIESAIASGNQLGYCRQMNVEYMTYKRHKKENNLCDDKSNYTFTKHTNDNKRRLSDVVYKVDHVTSVLYQS